jgi:hypothetical protein
MVFFLHEKNKIKIEQKINLEISFLLKVISPFDIDIPFSFDKPTFSFFSQS